MIPKYLGTMRNAIGNASADLMADVEMKEVEKSSLELEHDLLSAQSPSPPWNISVDIKMAGNI